ncbi:hypothetical protein BDU57DRAFT_437438 [Ampelomyces quisqualis]|uniref:Uncharacterized protein n=1 Tax=Ampelomyces quisqualis TaxID=50730 RepID=A0A6A5R193_AMPQU|nr:hypothetical protein BDU57DRAFT_437438 [Ampelomyces quisqualis]
MYNALAVLFSIFSISISSSIATALYLLPQFRFTPHTQPNTDLVNKCTFTLWHKQVQTNSARINYIQLNELQDHSNNITIDIAALRPVTARNSYSLISERQAFAIEGLLDNTNLTIRGSDGSDEIRCEHDGVSFTSDDNKLRKDAWCASEAWNDVGTSPGSRLQCAFPCEKVDDEEYNIELR